MNILLPILGEIFRDENSDAGIHQHKNFNNDMIQYFYSVFLCKYIYPK